MHRVVRYLAMACCIVAMTACSGGPSDSDVETAMKARISGMSFSRGSGLKVASAKNVRCTSVEAGSAYMCSVEVEMELPARGRMKSETQLKMVKSDGSWTYDKRQALSMQQTLPEQPSSRSFARSTRVSGRTTLIFAASLLAAVIVLVVLPGLIHRDLFKQHALRSLLFCYLAGAYAIFYSFSVATDVVFHGVSQIQSFVWTRRFMFHDDPVRASMVLVANLILVAAISAVARGCYNQYRIWLTPPSSRSKPGA